MKKVFTAVLAAVMLISFAACSGDKPDETTEKITQTDIITQTETENQTETEKSAQTETEAETEKETEQETVTETAAETENQTETEKPVQTETEAETEKETEKETVTEAVTEPVKKEITSQVEDIKFWTFDDAFCGQVIGVYCKTEPNATVILRDLNGTEVMRERAIDRYFFGRYVMPAGQSTSTVYFYAQSDGKEISKASKAVTLKYSDQVGANAMIAHDSHVFLNWYHDHYAGYATIPGDTEAEQQAYMQGIKGFLHAQLDQIRAASGKNTKIITVICTNPATIYHNVQYTEAEGGWGDHFMPTSVTQFAEFMKDDEDIYIVDIRDLLEANKNERLLFMQADSHWTQVAAYYAYYKAAQKIKHDFPDTKIYDLDKDFDITISPSGGDLLNFMGVGGVVTAATASVSWKDGSMAAPETAPTAYVMGDSYYGAFSGYLELMFSDIYLNTPETNPPLYDYTLEDLGEKQPDYLVYIWTERNIDGALGMLTASINAGNILN